MKKLFCLHIDNHHVSSRTLLNFTRSNTNVSRQLCKIQKMAPCRMRDILHQHLLLPACDQNPNNLEHLYTHMHESGEQNLPPNWSVPGKPSGNILIIATIEVLDQGFHSQQHVCIAVIFSLIVIITTIIIIIIKS